MAPVPPAPTPVPPVAAPPGPTVGQHTPFDAFGKSARNACDQRLEKLGVRKGDKIMAKTSAPMGSDNAVGVQTNVFGIGKDGRDITVFCYVVHMTADLTTSKTATFTKKGNEDFIVLERQEKCSNIFETAVLQNADFFKMPQNNRIVYDGQSQLFTTIDIFENTNEKKRLLQVNGADTKHKDLQSLPAITMEVYVGERPSIDYNHQALTERTADSNLDVNDRALTQLTELIFNKQCKVQSARFVCFEHGKVYVLNPVEERYDLEDTMDVGDGKYLLPGFKKTVNFIEGPHGRGFNNPSLVVDAMKAAFHKEQPVATKIMELVNTDKIDGLMPDHNIEQCLQVFKGLHVYANYSGKLQRMRIDGIHKDNAIRTKFDLGDGNSVSVADYLKQKYQVSLKFPNLNILICKHRGNVNFYPMELVTVSPNQRVSIAQQTSQQSQKTTRQCAVPPFKRTQLIMNGVRMMGMLEKDGQDLLNDFGLTFYENPLVVEGKMLPGKELSYGKSTVMSDNGKWRQPPKQFARSGGAVDVWAVYGVGRGMNNNDVAQVARKFLMEARARGLGFNEPAEAIAVPKNEVVGRIECAAKNNAKFILMLTDGNITDLHGQYKLLERKLEVVIQDITMKTARDILGGKNQTLENILNKTNIKLGGLNYVVNDKSLTEDQLIIGVGQSAPPPATRFMMEGKGFLNPTCIGYASNVVHPQEFSGDFTLAPPSSDTFVSMEEILTNVLGQWKTLRKSPLKRIIVYRTATAEGGYGPILELEVPLVRETISRCGFDAKLVYIVVSKEHNFRFFLTNINPKDKPTDQNITAGVLVDTQITHPSFKQFFLNSHRTLQGTAKTPSYIVLVDDFGAKMEKLEQLTNALCHHHQIVSMSTSLPSPLYIANEYAKRGRTLWIEKTSSNPPTTGESENNRLVDYTSELSYNTSKFSTRRINA